MIVKALLLRILTDGVPKQSEAMRKGTDVFRGHAVIALFVRLLVLEDLRAYFRAKGKHPMLRTRKDNRIFQAAADADAGSGLLAARAD